jgi:hypothetical protein
MVADSSHQGSVMPAHRTTPANRPTLASRAMPATRVMPPNSETSANRRVISNQGAHQVMRFINRRVSSAIALYWPAHFIKQSDSSSKLMSQSACDAQAV